MKLNVAKKILIILIIFILLFGLIRIPISNADVETHVSSITGKTFTEYKQNDFYEPNLACGGMVNENGCALTMVANIANGYGHNVTPSDVNNAYPSDWGIRKALKDYTGQDIQELSLLSETTIIERMKEGDVIWISWKSREHYSAVIDLDEENKKVYVINSYRGETLNGWQPISEVVNQCKGSFIKSDGKAYASTTSESASATTTSGLTYVSSSFNSPSCIKSNGRDGYKIDLDLDAEVEEMIKEIDTEESGIKYFLSSKNRNEYLKDFIKAEITTQYPDLRSAEEITADNTYDKVKEEVSSLIPELLESMESIGELDESILSSEQIEENSSKYSSYKTNVLEKGEIDPSEEYVSKKLKNESIQNKILKLIESNDVSQDKIHEILGSSISSSYNSDLVEKYYLAYINKLIEELSANVVNFEKFYTGDGADELTDEEKEKELQGCIKVKRVPSTGEDDSESAYFMSYMPSSDFEKLLDNYEASGDETFKKYFSLDTSGNLIVATGEVISTFNISTQEYEYQYIAKKTSINYLGQVSNYTMPFELLWTLLIYSQDEEFVHDLAKLAINSDIVISVYEDTTETKKTENKQTKKYRQKEVTVAYTNENGEEKTVTTEETEEYTEEETYYINYTTKNAQAMISYADTWIATYTYAITKKEESSSDNYTTQDDSTEVKKEDATEKDGDASNISEEQKQKIVNQIITQDGTNYLKKQVINQYIKDLEVGQTVTKAKPLPINLDSKTKNILSNNSTIKDIFYQMVLSYSSINSYTAIQSQYSTQIKDELRSNGFNDTEQESSCAIIIGLAEEVATMYNFNDDDVFKTQIPDSYIQSISGNVTIRNWNDATQISVGEETKTTEYVTSNGTVTEKTDKNDTKDNFVKILCNHSRAKANIRSISSWMFESMESNQYICNMIDLIKYLLQKAYGTDFGVTEFDFSIFDPKEFKSVSSNNANGTSGGAGYSSIEITQEDLEILYKITSAEWGTGSQEQQEHIASVILNRVLCEDWPDTIREVVFQDGQFQPTWDGGYDNANPSEITKAAVNAVIEKGDTTGGAVGFMTDWCFEENLDWINEANGWKELFRETDTNGATIVFFTKISAAEELKKYATSSEGSNGNIIECAEYIHKYMEENNYNYCTKGTEENYHSGSCGLDDTFEESKTNHHLTCCATYVSWVLREAGYMNETIHSASLESYGISYVLQNKYNFTKVSESDLQPGDVMVYNGHVQIYAGNGQIYNAGSTDSVQRANPYTSNWGKPLLYGLRAP